MSYEKKIVFVFGGCLAFGRERSVGQSCLWACGQVANAAKSLESQAFARAHRAITSPFHALESPLQSGCPCFQAALCTDPANEITPVIQGPFARKS